MGIPQRKADEQPVSIHGRAEENLRFIRSTMERAGAFTAVPGWGGVAMGLIGLAAALVGSRLDWPWAWLWIWSAAAVLGVATGGIGLVIKARKRRQSILHGPARKFWQGMVPALGLGGVLTALFVHLELFNYLPGLWLITYGLAVMVGGLFSVRPVQVMGLLFMVLGSAGLWLASWEAYSGHFFLGLGFGGLHIVFGIIIGRHHGG